MVGIGMGGIEVSASAALDQRYVSSACCDGRGSGADRPLCGLVETALRAF